METEKAIALAGGRPALASILGITPQATYGWRKEVPAKRLWQLREVRPEWFSDEPTNQEVVKARERQAARLQRIVTLAKEITREARRWHQI